MDGRNETARGDRDLLKSSRLFLSTSFSADGATEFNTVFHDTFFLFREFRLSEIAICLN